MSVTVRGPGALAEELPGTGYDREQEGGHEENREEDPVRTDTALEARLASGVGLQALEKVQAVGDAAVPPGPGAGIDAILSRHGGQSIEKICTPSGQSASAEAPRGSGLSA